MMAKVRYIRVGRLKSLPGYENFRIEIEVELNENENPVEVYNSVVDGLELLTKIE